VDISVGFAFFVLAFVWARPLCPPNHPFGGLCTHSTIHSVGAVFMAAQKSTIHSVGAVFMAAQKSTIHSVGAVFMAAQKGQL